MAVRVISIVTGYPSITSVKHNNFISLPLFFHRQRWISAFRATVPFNSTGKADHCAALIPALRRVLRRVLLLMLRRVLLLMMWMDGCTADQRKLDHRAQIETDSGAAKVAAGIAVPG